MTPVQGSLVAALERAGYRCTGPRRVVAEAITRRGGPFTAGELLDDLRQDESPIGRATMFRALDLFSDLKVLERLDVPGGEHRYVPCEPVHHHHVICSRCGTAAEVDACSMPAVLKEVTERTGFRVEHHRLELYGICADCQKKPSRGAADT